jgi:hypothetical protein
MNILCLPGLSWCITIQTNTARCNDKREVYATITRSVHWSTKLCTSINIVTFVGEWLLLSAKWTLFHCYFIARTSYIRWDDDDSCFLLDWHTSFPLFESRFRDLIATKFNFLLAAMFHPILSGHNYVPNCWHLIIYSR